MIQSTQMNQQMVEKRKCDDDGIPEKHFKHIKNRNVCQDKALNDNKSSEQCLIHLPSQRMGNKHDKTSSHTRKLSSYLKGPSHVGGNIPSHIGYPDLSDNYDLTDIDTDNPR